MTKLKFKCYRKKVDNVCSEQQISDHWADIYGNLFSTGQSESKKQAVLEYVNDNCNDDKLKFIDSTVILDVLKCLKSKKAVGSDNLQSEYFKLA